MSVEVRISSASFTNFVTTPWLPPLMARRRSSNSSDISTLVTLKLKEDNNNGIYLANELSFAGTVKCSTMVQ